jgi:hypothetical protein
VKKCDYLVLDKNQNRALFIELKGRHAHEAYKQILATIDRYKHTLKKMRIQVRIVFTRNPKIRQGSSPERRLIEKRLQALNKSYNPKTDFITRSFQFEEKFNLK